MRIAIAIGMFDTRVVAQRPWRVFPHLNNFPKQILFRIFLREAMCGFAQESMEQILSVLYGASGVAASALYVPQILKYHRDPDARMSISLLSWGGWIAIAIVTILYALYVVKSHLIAMVAGLNVAAQFTVLCYGVSARFNRRSAAAPRSSATSLP